jgi:hypothetical protein
LHAKPPNCCILTEQCDKKPRSGLRDVLLPHALLAASKNSALRRKGKPRNQAGKPNTGAKKFAESGSFRDRENFWNRENFAKTGLRACSALLQYFVFKIQK